MRARLQDELYSFLKPNNISGLLIFRDWLLKKCELEDKKSDCYFYGNVGFDDLFFKTERLNESQLKKLLLLIDPDKTLKTELLTFIKIKKEKFNAFKLNEEHFFEKLIPQFKQDLTNQSIFTSEEITKYQLLSKANFMSTEAHAEQLRLKKTLTDRINDFFSKLNLDKEHYDIFQNGLLKIACIDLNQSRWSLSTETNDLRVTINCSASEDPGNQVQELMAYFHKQGDISASISSRQHYDAQGKKTGYKHQPDGIKISSNKISYHSQNMMDGLFHYSCSVDADFFIQAIWPKIQVHISPPEQKAPPMPKRSQRQRATTPKETRQTQLNPQAFYKEPQTPANTEPTGTPAGFMCNHGY